MILVDTNIISELIRPQPEPKVEAWLAGQRSADCFLSTVTEAELRYGIQLLPTGQRRDNLQLLLNGILEQDFGGRILPFESAAAAAYSVIAGNRRRLGRPISQMDAMIAAIANSNGATLATRNISDFGDCGIQIVNPWSP